MATQAEPRIVCPACRRPVAVCYCAHVERLASRTRVVILQHPRERDVPINTARIAALCLPNAELDVGVCWSRTPTLERALSDPERPPVLLYPGPDAIDIEEAPPRGPVTLIVVDGTWWQARKIVRTTPELARVPRYAFRPRSPSDYRIRKEPQADYVSTVEAIVHVLGVLEGDPSRFVPMLVPFRAMVDAQVAFRTKGPGRGRGRQMRPPRIDDPFSRVPRLVRERPQDLVCVHAEANSWAYGSRERALGDDDLVQWVACRVATGETLEAFVAPRVLAPSTVRHVRVDAETLLGGGTAAALAAEWQRFVRPSDIVCTWAGYSTNLFERDICELENPRVDIRSAARVFARGRVGTPADFLDHLGVSTSRLPLARGRAGERLAELVAIMRAWSDRTTSEQRS